MRRARHLVLIYATAFVVGSVQAQTTGGLPGLPVTRTPTAEPGLYRYVPSGASETRS
jgi:hypothetical protein